MPEEVLIATPIDYPALAREHAEGVIARALAAVARSGVPAGHRILITFVTAHPGVDVPADIVSRHPGEMTVVLENQIGDLSVGAGCFSAELDFGTPRQVDWRRVRVPLAAVTEYRDGSYVIGMVPSAAPAPAFPPADAVLPGDGGNIIRVPFPLQAP